MTQEEGHDSRRFNFWFFVSHVNKCDMDYVFSWVPFLSPHAYSRPLEVVIIPTAQTSCWNMLEQLRGKSWHGLSISTQADSHPMVSSEYNPFISCCPQFLLMKAWKKKKNTLSEGFETNKGLKIRWETLFDLCALLSWHGSIRMCKSFITVNMKFKKKERKKGRLVWSVTFLVFFEVFLRQLVSLRSVDAVGTPGEPHDDGDDGGLEEEHHPVGGCYGWSG